MNGLIPSRPQLRPGIELGFRDGNPLIYDGTEPVAIDAQAGKGKLARFLGVNLISPRTAHLTKIITDPKDGELAWVAWKTLEREGYRVLFINPGQFYGWPSARYNINTRLLEIAQRPELRALVGEAAYDAASFLFPIDPEANNRWIGLGMRTAAALYYKRAALLPTSRWPCTPGGLWDFYGRGREEIRDDLLLWAADRRMEDDAGMCLQIASLTGSLDQWNAYASSVLERLQGFQPGNAARWATDENSFDPADMKHERTALFIATILVTAMLLNKQTELELQKEAKVMLFDQKHQIYMDTIEKVAEIVEKRAFDSKIFDDLRVLNHKVAMIGSVSVIETFYKVLQKMQSGFQDGNIQQQEAETIMHLLAEVTFEMRKDLLQEISDQDDDRIFDAILENSRGVEKIENTGQS